MTTDDELAKGSVFPAVDQIRTVSLNVAIACARDAYDKGLARANPARGARAHEPSKATRLTVCRKHARLPHRPAVVAGSARTTRSRVRDASAAHRPPVVARL
eukprot:784692-Prymnesium_polylepis.1